MSSAMVTARYRAGSPPAPGGQMQDTTDQPILQYNMPHPEKLAARRRLL